MDKIQEIVIDPLEGFVVFYFATFDDRADFSEQYVPSGKVYANSRHNTEPLSHGPPFRLSFKLKDFDGPFALKLKTAIAPAETR